MGLVKEMIKHMFSKQCANHLVCDFVKKHPIPNITIEDIKDMDGLKTKCSRCETPLLCFVEDDWCYFTEDFGQTTEECIRDHCISIKDFLKGICGEISSKELWKNLYHEMICTIKNKHITPSTAIDEMDNGGQDVRTECERCKIPLVLKINDDNPDKFWIMEDYEIEYS